MRSIPLQDGLDIYPVLVDIARRHDDGDTDELNPVPYHITPEDLQSCNEDIVCRESLDKFEDHYELGHLDIIELYKQLVRLDYQKDHSIDGRITVTRFPRHFRLPYIYSSARYLGDEWSAAAKLFSYVNGHQIDILAAISDIGTTGGVDQPFPFAKAVTKNDYEHLYKGPGDDTVKPLSPDDIDYLDKVVTNLRAKNREDLAEIVDSFKGIARVKNVSWLPVDFEHRAAENMLFEQDIPVFFMVDEGAGQEEFTTGKTRRPPVGWMQSESHVSQLKAWFSSRHFKDAPIGRMPYLLENVFVKEYFPCIKLFGEKPYRKFPEVLAIHEAIHYDDMTSPPTDYANIPPAFLGRFTGLLEKRQKGALTFDERKEYGRLVAHFRRLLLEKKRKLEVEPPTRLGQSKEHHLVEQLTTLIVEDYENLVDHEAMILTFGPEKLANPKYRISFGSEKDMLLSPNDMLLSDYEEEMEEKARKIKERSMNGKLNEILR